MPELVKYKRSLLLKYAAMYLIALFVPLTIVSVFFVPMSSNMQRERLLSDKRAEFAAYSEDLNNQVDRIISCANRLSSSENIYLYRLSHPTLYGPSIIRDIRTNVFSSDLLSDIYIVSPSLPYAYSSLSTYSFGRLAERLTEGGLNAAEYEEFLKTLDEQRMTIVRNGNSILLYFHFPVSDIHSNTYLIFEISWQMLEQYFQDFPQNYHLTVTAADGDTIFEAGSETKPSDIVFLENQPTLEWTLQFSLPKSDIDYFTQSFLITAIGLLAAVVCLGVVLAGCFSYFNYKPLQNLKTDLEALVEGEPGELFVDELQTIRRIALELYSSAQALRGKGREAYKNFIFLRLIHGITADYRAEKDRLSEFGLFLESDYCFVVVIYFNGDSLPDTYSEFWENYARENEKTAYAILGSQPSQIILLIFGDSEQVESYVPFLEAGLDRFSSTYSLSATMGVGLVYLDIESICLSYAQAEIAYEYRSIQDHRCVSLFDPNRAVSMSTDNAFGSALDAFHKAAIRRNPDEVSEAAKQISDYIKTNPLTVYSARAACHYLTLAVSMVLNDMPYPANDPMYIDEQGVSESPEHFLQFILSLEKVLRARFSPCDTGRLEPDRATRKLLSTQICEYIDENTANNQLSVASVAKHFGFSVSYVSRIFKEEIGKTILEYLNGRRISLACELLRETNKSIEVIVNEIGYFDTSSFIRKFKKEVGTTPGEYRKQ